METLAAPQTGPGKPERFSGSLRRTTCEHCGTPFPPGPRRGKPRRWCNDTCRKAARDLEVVIGLKVLRGLADDLLRRVVDGRAVRQLRS